ncbi:Endonuclease/exonuclease/phosphatase [Tribonema minus]|uniref:Endonuclease/exonuclease/phosphatase n=1 Tax=Tribonema minus TaxID=303371 RepID=A0A835Z3I4_9STRA|nr:Endonuclease/exonuclease/phosphatase [Tribonema minus]
MGKSSDHEASRAYVYSTQRTSTGLANKAYSQSDHTFEFKWYRGPERQACANALCPRAASFSPLEWSTYALQGCRIQCIICSRLKVPRHKSIFCNAKCFKQAWKEHRATHAAVAQAQKKATNTAPGTGSDPSSPSLAGDGVDMVTVGSGEGGGALGVSIHSELLSIATGLSATGLLKGELLPEEHEDNGEDQWELFSTEPCITPSAADVGHCLRLECRAVLPDGSLVCMPRSVSTEPVLSVPPPPPRRALLAASKGPPPPGRFRIVSYNLLAEIYATQQAYPSCDFWALSWNYRRANLARELVESAADVLCLQKQHRGGGERPALQNNGRDTAQLRSEMRGGTAAGGSAGAGSEVQADAYHAFFQPLLLEKGFDGLYKSKTRESMGLVGKVDGCALFWRRNRFRLVENYAIEFNECARRSAGAIGLSPNTEEGNQYMHRLSKDNIAQVAVLELLQRPRAGRMGGPQQLCIANTHLYRQANPELPDVKLWQCHALLQELEHLVELEHFVMSRQLPLMVCGDLNSEPSSAVYELISTQRVSADHPDLSQDPCHVLPDASELTHNLHLQITHNLHLQSAYAAVTLDEPPYTNYTDSFRGTLDYIWCSAPDLRPLAVMQVPSEDDIRRCGPSMPNVAASSDHVLLCADVQVDRRRCGPSMSNVAASSDHVLLCADVQPQKYYSKG